MALSEYIARALCCNPEEAEELASELELELDKEDGLPALIKELKKILATSLATANWLESIGEKDHADRMRTNASKEIQPQINAAESGILDARAALRILAGEIWEARAANAVHLLYCSAVEVAHGKRDAGGFKKKCNAYYASLQHKLVKANDEGLGTNGGGVWFHLSYLNGAAYVASLRLQMNAIPACERRASLTLDAPSEIPPALWLWIREAQREGIVQGLPTCSLGNVEELRAAYGRARVLHNAVGSVATSNGEKAKAKAGYEHDLHPFADHGHTVAQAYVHDDSGVRMLAPFPKRPVIAIKGSKKRARIENVPKGFAPDTTDLQPMPTRQPAIMTEYEWKCELMLRRDKFIEHTPTRFYIEKIRGKGLGSYY